MNDGLKLLQEIDSYNAKRGYKCWVCKKPTNYEPRYFVTSGMCGYLYHPYLPYFICDEHKNMELNEEKCNKLMESEK